MMGGFNDYGGYGPSPWMWLVGGLMMLLFWGGLAVLVVWVVRAVGGRGANHSPQALEVLRTRLAAGEISVDEYEKTRRILQG